ncbi:tol-pal system YbgF family protein, partial [Pricia sp.]|uniref:tol-pal system YbgF family protein n=1 Tax=Pricia sp. TaxID=2268138 RepID=UPI003594632D
EKRITDETPVRTLPRRNYPNWAIAASIALLVGFGWLGYHNFFGSNYADLYQENFQEYPNTVYTITRSDAVESIEREGFAAYEAGNYKTAIDNFEKIPPKNQKPYLDFYRAQSYLQIDKTEEAKKLFKTNIRNGSAFVPESHWYLALTYLREKDTENALLQLQALTTRYDYNKEKASTLLQELE